MKSSACSFAIGTTPEGATPRSVYKGHTIRDIVLFWKKFKGQGHLRTTLLPIIKGHPHTVPLK